MENLQHPQTHIKWPSIEQFRHVLKEITTSAQYIGQSEDNTPIYDYSVKLPVITFKGTPKLHGSNAGITYNIETDEMWYQSREQIITPLKDNAGFAQFAEYRKEIFREFFKSCGQQKGLITLFGEWAGPGIQKGVGINLLPQKSFFIFGLKFTDSEHDTYFSETNWSSPDNFIYNIEDYENFEVEVDFSRPDIAQNKILELTLKVEEECPVAKAHGFSGIGEGIVFSAMYKDKVYRFKSKGEKHSSTKVTSLKPVDNAKEQAKQDFATYACTPWRLEQAFNEVNDTLNGSAPDMKNIGDFLKAVNKDIIKEELDILQERCLEFKEVAGSVAKIAKRWYQDQI